MLGVRVDVAGGDGGHPQPLGEPGEPAIAAAVAAPEGPLQLDPEAVPPEGTEQPPGGLRSCRHVPPLPGGGKHSGPGASREADQALGVLFELLQRHRRLPGAALRVVARVGVRGREQAAEVAIADRVLSQERQVGVPPHRHLGAGDCPDSQTPCRRG